jgi:hypothetical protein
MGASDFILCELGGELASFRNSVGGRWAALVRTASDDLGYGYQAPETPATSPPLPTKAILLTGLGYDPDSRVGSTAGGYILNRRQFVTAAACAAGAPLLAAAYPAEGEFARLLG